MLLSLRKNGLTSLFKEVLLGFFLGGCGHRNVPHQACPPSSHYKMWWGGRVVHAGFLADAAAAWEGGGPIESNVKSLLGGVLLEIGCCQLSKGGVLP